MNGRGHLALAFTAGAGAVSLTWFISSRRSRFSSRNCLPVSKARRGPGGRSHLYVGVDLGGTTVSVALVDEAGKILSKTTVGLCSDRSFQAVVQLITSHVPRSSARQGFALPM